MKTKRPRIVWILVLVLALCVPIHVNMTDGGSEGWYAMLWQLDHCHEISANGFLVGTRVSLLFGLIPVYDDTHEEPMTPAPEEPTASTREEPAAPARGESALSPEEALPAPHLPLPIQGVGQHRRRVEATTYKRGYYRRGGRCHFGTNHRH